jgi:hypothetical protein
LTAGPASYSASIRWVSDAVISVGQFREFAATGPRESAIHRPPGRPTAAFLAFRSLLTSRFISA